MTHHKQTVGFTLVEMMLAMAFVSALLLAIAVTTMQIMGTYTKGLTVREVNQAGRSISEDIQRTIASSAPFEVSQAAGVDSRYITRPGGGRLCTGAYTYAWNYGKTKELSGATSINAYNTYAGSSDRIRLVKVSDTGGALCVDTGMPIKKEQAKELLLAGDRNLAVQELTVSSHARNDASSQALYAITLTIGTNDQTQLNATRTNCLAPSQGSGNEDFCAINQFNIIARAGNRSGSLQ